MRILAALILLMVSVIASIQAFPIDFAFENYTNILALIVLPFVALYVLWRLADNLLTPRPGEFETDRRLSRVIGSPWEWREQ